jgi:undecaprenyl-diphosphatase
VTRNETPIDSTDPRAWRMLLAASLIAFIAIAVNVVSGGPLTTFDPWAAQGLLGRGSGGWSDAMRILARVHGVAGIGIVGGLWAALLWHRRKTAQLAALLLVVGGGLLLNGALKLLFQRQRPVLAAGLDPPLEMLATWSFPSGHVSGSVVFYGFLLMTLFARTSNRGARRAGVIAVTAMVVLVAYNRLYLGVHFATDVLAAVAEGLAWLAFCALLLESWRLPARDRDRASRPST